jgi:hypothetical protein
MTPKDWLHLTGFAALVAVGSVGVAFTLIRIVDWFLA